MLFYHLTLTFIVIHTLNAIKTTNSFELYKNISFKTFYLNVRAPFRDTYIRFDDKQWETCSETFFRTVFFENIKIESNSRFVKYYIRVYQR